MTRRLLVPVTLFVVGLATFTLTTRFVAWGDELATSVGEFMAKPPPVPPASGGGIDFVECYGCDNLPGTEGFGLGILALLLAGGPLAFAARLLERRRHDFGVVPVTAAWCQAGFVVQGASLCLAMLIMYAFVTIASPTEFVHWISATALVDIFAGVPALTAWRRLLAGSMQERGSLLRLERA